MKPNILCVVTTQWRAQATGYAGDVNAHTPRLDALAATAVNFTQAVTPHPFGPFARAALLTGVRSPENGVRDYFDPLPVTAHTMAHALAERGYATGFFGKWHLWRRDPAEALVGEAHARVVVPTEARGGFEFWEGFESGFLLNDPWLHGTRLPEPVRVAGYQSDVVCERAALWMTGKIPCAEKVSLESAGSGSALRRPWFCVVSLEAPHPPYDAPASGVKPVEPEKVTLAANVPLGGDVEAKARRELAGYYTHIAATDTAIGRMFDALRAANAESFENTVIVFTSAHGDMHGAHGLFRKGWPHEESVRVPLLVRAPGAAAGERTDTVSLGELPEMLLGLADHGELRSRGSRGTLISMPSVVALPLQCDRVWRGVRTATRKLVLDGSAQPWLFFDLASDPGEMRNLVGESAYAEEIAALAQRYLARR
jgi:arylsulfatase A-like enzyme